MKGEERKRNKWKEEEGRWKNGEMRKRKAFDYYSNSPCKSKIPLKKRNDALLCFCIYQRQLTGYGLRVPLIKRANYYQSTFGVLSANYEMFFSEYF